MEVTVCNHFKKFAPFVCQGKALPGWLRQTLTTDRKFLIVLHTVTPSSVHLHVLLTISVLSSSGLTMLDKDTLTYSVYSLLSLALPHKGSLHDNLPFEVIEVSIK